MAEPHNPPKTIMFSHVVIFWTHPEKPQAADDLIVGAQKYLADIPGVQHFHVGRMMVSQRRVVDQTYQVALNVQFKSRQDQDDYQVHPLHIEFLEKYEKRTMADQQSGHHLVIASQRGVQRRVAVGVVRSRRDVCVMSEQHLRDLRVTEERGQVERCPAVRRH